MEELGSASTVLKLVQDKSQDIDVPSIFGGGESVTSSTGDVALFAAVIVAIIAVAGVVLYKYFQKKNSLSFGTTTPNVETSYSQQKIAKLSDSIKNMSNTTKIVLIALLCVALLGIGCIISGNFQQKAFAEGNESTSKIEAPDSTEAHISVDKTSITGTSYLENTGDLDLIISSTHLIRNEDINDNNCVYTLSAGDRILYTGESCASDKKTPYLFDNDIVISAGEKLETTLTISNLDEETMTELTDKELATFGVYSISFKDPTFTFNGSGYTVDGAEAPLTTKTDPLKANSVFACVSNQTQFADDTSVPAVSLNAHTPEGQELVLKTLNDIAALGDKISVTSLMSDAKTTKTLTYATTGAEGNLALIKLSADLIAMGDYLNATIDTDTTFDYTPVAPSPELGDAAKKAYITKTGLSGELRDSFFKASDIRTIDVNWTDDDGISYNNAVYLVKWENSYYEEEDPITGETKVVYRPFMSGLEFNDELTLETAIENAFNQHVANGEAAAKYNGAFVGSDIDLSALSETEKSAFLEQFTKAIYQYIGADKIILNGADNNDASTLATINKLYQTYSGKTDGAVVTSELSNQDALNANALITMSNAILTNQGKTFEGQNVMLSGFNPKVFSAIELLIAKGACALTVSDSTGYIYDPDGFDAEKLAFLKNVYENQGQLKEYVEEYPTGKWVAGKTPYSERTDICFVFDSTQQISVTDAKALVVNGVYYVAEFCEEGVASDAATVFTDAKILYLPSLFLDTIPDAITRANAEQSLSGTVWSGSEAIAKVNDIVHTMHSSFAKYGTEPDGWINYEKGILQSPYYEYAPPTE